MFYVLLIVAIGAVVSLSIIAGSAPMGLRGTALHPFNILSVIYSVIILDFCALYFDTLTGITTSFSGYTISSVSEVDQGLLFFTFAAWASVLACHLAIRDSSLIAPREQDNYHRKSWANDPAFWTFVLFLGMAGFVTFQVVIYSIARGSIFYVSSIRQSFFTKNPIYPLLYSTAVPALYVVTSRFRLSPVTWFAFIAIVILMLPLGSRSLIFYSAVALAIAANMRYYISGTVTFILLPFMGMLSVYLRFIGREFGNYASMQQFLEVNGGYFSLLFRSLEISMAESITVGATQDTITRHPWDSLLAISVAPIPRAILPWKPFGASAQFTMESAGDFWRLVRSERTITGLVNAKVEFGYIGALIFIFFATLLWARIITRQATEEGRLFGMAIGIITAYTFWRGDFYNTGLFLWPVLPVLMVFWALSRRSRVSRP